MDRQTRHPQEKRERAVRTVRGVQYLSIRYTERPAGADCVTSVGSRGDSYRCSIARELRLKKPDSSK